MRQPSEQERERATKLASEFVNHLNILICSGVKIWQLMPEIEIACFAFDPTIENSFIIAFPTLIDCFSN